MHSSREHREQYLGPDPFTLDPAIHINNKVTRFK